MAHFRKTWRHEVIIDANTADEAIQIWEKIDLGALNHAVWHGEVISHEFVENVSFEDENNNDVVL